MLLACLLFHQSTLINYLGLPVELKALPGESELFRKIF